MPDNVIYLITGANRGIGKAMVSDLLLRPSTTVIATVRDPLNETVKSLVSLPTGENSTLLIVPLNTAVPGAGYDSLRDRLVAGRITHLDVVIANAGTSSGFKPMLETTGEDLKYDFEVNSIGPLELFKATWPLLAKSDADDSEKKKFVLITSSVGSIGGLEEEAFPGSAYGMSKAAANWFAKKLSVEFKGEGLKVGIIHPGWVKTSMGQMLADTVGFSEPPMTVEDSSRHVLEQVNKLSLASTSGKFISYNGKAMAW